MFDPEEYAISVRKERVDGDIFYVGRVAEFPHLTAFEETADEARAVILDAVSTLQEAATEKGEELPAPASIGDEAFSGRFTLRLPKSLHAKMYRLSDREGVSLNQLFTTAIAAYAGEISGAEMVAATVAQRLNTLPAEIHHSLGRVLQRTGQVTTIESGPQVRLFTALDAASGATSSITNSIPPAVYLDRPSIQ